MIATPKYYKIDFAYLLDNFSEPFKVEIEDCLNDPEIQYDMLNAIVRGILADCLADLELTAHDEWFDNTNLLTIIEECKEHLKVKDTL